CDHLQLHPSAGIQGCNLYGRPCRRIVWKELAVNLVELWEVVEIRDVGSDGGDVLEIHPSRLQDVSQVGQRLAGFGFNPAWNELGGDRIASKVARQIQGAANLDPWAKRESRVGCLLGANHSATA